MQWLSQVRRIVRFFGDLKDAFDLAFILFLVGGALIIGVIAAVVAFQALPFGWAVGALVALLIGFIALQIGATLTFAPERRAKIADAWHGRRRATVDVGGETLGSPPYLISGNVRWEDHGDDLLGDTILGDSPLCPSEECLTPLRFYDRDIGWRAPIGTDNISQDCPLRCLGCDVEYFYLDPHADWEPFNEMRQKAITLLKRERNLRR